MTELKTQLQQKLAAFAAGELRPAALDLLATLGYRSDKTADLGGSPEAFLEHFDHNAERPLNKDKALFADWRSIHLLFQLADDDLSGEGNLFASGDVERGNMASYLFFAVELTGRDYTRGRLAQITRQLNRLFPMPVMVLFKVGQASSLPEHQTRKQDACATTLSIAVINRRRSKVDADKDVLGKVTLIHGIGLQTPHRGHLDILASFAVENLQLSSFRLHPSFDSLHAAWEDVFNVELLNKRFYKKIQEWFFWAVQNAKFPHGGIDDEGQRNRIAVIRLLTRVIFCWFAREKGLLRPSLFEASTARKVLKDFSLEPLDQSAIEKQQSKINYYLAILQNLFFPTLSIPLDQREFRNGRRYRGVNKHYMHHEFFRHEALFKDASDLERLFADIPFLNGGLFECLDSGTCKADELRVDGFSDEPANQPLVPNVLFFGKNLSADLHEPLNDDQKTAVAVDGLFTILESFKFTVTENTPVEEEIALDPELLGRIFENLLAEYNPETEKTARKQTGSFYTPRSIVDYMATEALKAYLLKSLTTEYAEDTEKIASVVSVSSVSSVVKNTPLMNEADAQTGLDILFAYTEREHPFTDAEKRVLLDAIYDATILDPACGSGAFPMGMLQKLVYVLEKLDHGHDHWKQRILKDTPPAMKEETRKLLAHGTADFLWKLGLIQRCIYGIDIQPIAVQIAKLRCFVSLLVDFQVNPAAENCGVPALPNLDFKFVAANTLIKPPEGLERAGDLALGDPFFEKFEKLAAEYFFVRDPEIKKDLRGQIETLIEKKIAERESAVATKREQLLRAAGKTLDKQQTAAKKKFEADIAAIDRETALWRSYRNLFASRNAPAQFFDPRYFFPEIKDGFDITIGNPPYVRADEQSDWNQLQRKAILDSKQFETLWEKWDLFVPFIERAYKLLRPGGVSTLIVSDAFCHSKYAQKPQNWLLQNARILRLDFCTDLKIFEAAVHNVITFVQKADGTEWKPERRVHKEAFGNVTLLPTDTQSNLTYRAFFPEDGEATTLHGDYLLLDQICYISKGMVVHADEKKARGAFELSDLVAEKCDNLHSRRFVEGKHLERWSAPTCRWLEWGSKRAPALFSRPTFPELYDVPEKVMSVDLSVGTGKLRVAYDDSQLLHNHSAWSFVAWHHLAGVRNNSLKKTARYKGENPPRPDLPRREELEETSRRFAVKYLLGVMNSSTARDFLRANRRSNIHLYPDDWKKLPIPDVTPEQQQPIITLVDQILTTKRATPAADITALEAQVDRLVAGLYGVEGGE